MVYGSILVEWFATPDPATNPLSTKVGIFDFNHDISFVFRLAKVIGLYVHGAVNVTEYAILLREKCLLVDLSKTLHQHHLSAAS